MIISALTSQSWQCTLSEDPKRILPLLDQVATKCTLENFPNYGNIQKEIFVRIENHPLPEPLRDLRKEHLRGLVRVSGIVTRRSTVMPQLTIITYVCKTCNQHVGAVEVTDTEDKPEPPPCSTCDADEDQFSRVVPDYETSIYRNFQRILLQESPGSVNAGRVPRYKYVLLTNDLIDTAQPGEEIEVTGTYVNQLNRVLNMQQGFPVFSTCIEANYIQRKNDADSTALLITEEDRKEFYRLAKDPRITDRIINSIAPSMYGNRNIKTALACSMFGGRAKNINNKHKIRGDINVLLMGDPGTAKSQCLKYVEKTAPRAVFTTGKGASAVGLTAAVQKDPITKEWVLEAGALVLADRGVCMIDEFDKMNDKDRVSIHEAMEQQSISISKAGIVTTLQARCSVIAAANPINGRYDPQKTFADNVELTDPIIQRFDILCILQDRINEIDDERLAKFVVSSHVKAHPEGCLTSEEAIQQAQRRAEANPAASQAQEGEDEEGKNVDVFAGVTAPAQDPIDQALLKKYILYARTLKPQLSHIDHDMLERLYSELRAESTKSGGVPIAVRHMESVLRIAESFARMGLRNHVNDDDVNRAIAVMIESFVSAQKKSTKSTLQRQFRKYLTQNKDNNELLAYILEDQLNQAKYLRPGESLDSLRITTAEFAARAVSQAGIRDLSHFFKSDQFTNEFVLEEKTLKNRTRPIQYIVKRFTRASNGLELY